jgi:hypothetical protein
MAEAGAIPNLIPLFDSPYQEVQAQVLTCMYYLCRLNVTNQEQAVLHGIIPFLQRIIRSRASWKQFAFPIIISLQQGSKRYCVCDCVCV